MLIIPIQNKPDWSRPPIVTLGLILINVLVFLLYQGQDRGILDRAAGIYESNRLLEREEIHYVQYLQKNKPAELAKLEQEPAEFRREIMFWSIFYDRGFDHYLTSVWQQKKNAEIDAWHAARHEFQKVRNRLSSFRAGLTPRESEPWTFVSSLFLHGGWGHLIGNMLFLFLFGFTLEGALRAYQYLGMYLASGLVASGLFVVFNLNSHVPLIGASGAVSGLMGMYLALYRLRRIRFFYTAVFYFGEFTAPALFILPLWLAKELYGHFFIDSNVAYWAHVGGLLAGAGLMYAATRSQRSFAEKEDKHAEEYALARQLKAVQAAVGKLDYDRARALARGLCQQYPAHFSPWQTLFDLHKLQPQQKKFHQTVFDILKQFAGAQVSYTAWAPGVDELLQEYAVLAPTMPAVNGRLYLALARKAWSAGARHQAEHYLQQAAKKRVERQYAESLLADMRTYYRGRNQPARADRFAALFPKSAELSPPPGKSSVAE